MEQHTGKKAWILGIGEVNRREPRMLGIGATHRSEGTDYGNWSSTQEKGLGHWKLWEQCTGAKEQTLGMPGTLMLGIGAAHRREGTHTRNWSREQEKSHRGWALSEQCTGQENGLQESQEQQISERGVSLGIGPAHRRKGVETGNWSSVLKKGQGH